MDIHVYRTTDEDNGESFHMALSEDGARYTHYVHRRMTHGYRGILVEDLGIPSASMLGKGICIDPVCIGIAMANKEISV